MAGDPDITIDPFVTIHGDQFIVNCNEIDFDTRRAFVQGNDVLVINYGNDFKGGTTIEGDLNMPSGSLKGGATIEGDLNMSSGSINMSSGDLNMSSGRILGLSGQLKIEGIKQAGTMSPAFYDASIILDDGKQQVIISLKDFTGSTWPVWPGEPVGPIVGSVIPSLYLIDEIRRMKNEIITLRQEVDKLKSGGK